MDKYLAPVNPSHTLLLREEDMWWVDDAWDEATLDKMTPIVSLEEGGTRGRQEVVAISFLRSLLENLRINLPGLLPSGEWLMRYGLRMVDAGVISRHPKPDFGAKASVPYQYWEGVTFLSEPIRFVIYLHEQCRAGRIGDLLTALLLSCSELTEDDRDYFARNSERLPVNPTRHFLSNHSLAGTEHHHALIKETIAKFKEGSPLHLPNGELLLAAVANPATPMESLAYIASHFMEESAELIILHQNCYLGNSGLIAWEDAAVKFWHQKSQTLGWPVVNKSEEKVSRVQQHISAHGALLQDIYCHPNWDGSDLVRVLPSGNGSNLYPTKPADSFTVAHASSSYFTDGPTFSALRKAGEKFLSVDGHIPSEGFAVIVASIGAIGRERLEALGLTSRDVPDEWVNLIFG